MQFLSWIFHFCTEGLFIHSNLTTVTEQKKGVLVIQLLATITVAVTLVATSASAFDPAHLKRLMETGDCINCDLSGANLKDAKLMDADMTNANLIGAKLMDADLTNAHLGGANLSGANLTEAELNYAFMKSVILCNTTMPDGSVLYSGC